MTCSPWYNSHTIRNPWNNIQLYKLNSDPEILMTVAEKNPKNMFIKNKICFVPANSVSLHGRFLDWIKITFKFYRFIQKIHIYLTLFVHFLSFLQSPIFSLAPLEKRDMVKQ